jgi:hypothetical protein
MKISKFQKLYHPMPFCFHVHDRISYENFVCLTKRLIFEYWLILWNVNFKFYES